ncbi:MAG: MiaB/RimO family radical SAM methylthiotransferase [Pseudomonadota bacterium]
MELIRDRTRRNKTESDVVDRGPQGQSVPSSARVTGNAGVAAGNSTSDGSLAKSVYIKTYGCQMNVYDSERMADLLAPLGYGKVDKADGADLVILNTCHIREKAAEKVYSELGRLRRLKEGRKKEGKELTVAVAGCVAQAEGAEMRERAPVVDMVFGPQAYHRLPEILAKTVRARGDILQTDFAVEEKFDVLADRRRVDGPTAFLTVQEGCDKFCTFCVVPYTRGAEVSRSADAITAEARALVRAGVREITLLGQNVNGWRASPPPGEVVQEGEPNNRANKNTSANNVSDKQSCDSHTWGLGAMCRHLAKIDGLERIRFTTSHPRDMDEELIAALCEEPKLMPYLHLPVQSGSDKILKAMNRGHTADHYKALMARIRNARPDIALSGDFIVGFPGETDADFEETMQLVRDVEYASAFSFKYSRRPGTPAAAMRMQVPERDKDTRLAALQALLEEQKNAFNAAQIGKTLTVLFEREGRNPGQIIGRSPYLQSVHINGPLSLIGSIASVRIEGQTPNALSGVLVDNA